MRDSAGYADALDSKISPTNKLLFLSKLLGELVQIDLNILRLTYLLALRAPADFFALWPLCDPIARSPGIIALGSAEPVD